MSADETYNGWTNRETWAVALHINNDQGWQESVLEALREARTENDVPLSIAFQVQDVKWEATGRAAKIIRENVDEVLNPYSEDGMNVTEDVERALLLLQVQADIGSLWRVNWTELGVSFLADLRLEDN